MTVYKQETEREKKEMKKLLNYCNVKLTPDNSNPCLKLTLTCTKSSSSNFLRTFYCSGGMLSGSNYFFAAVKALIYCHAHGEVDQYCEVHKKPTYQNAYIMICNSAGLSKQAFFAPTCRLYGN